MDVMVQRAIEFATQAHAGQTRKYTGEPYVNHPIEVMKLVSMVTDDPEVLAAAVLHDVVEDTPATIMNIRIGFTPRVAALVDDLTDVSKPEDGNRATRKELDRQHTRKHHPMPRLSNWLILSATARALSRMILTLRRFL